MKASVIYDSQYGNTEKIARAVGEGLGTQAEVEVIHVRDANTAQLTGLDVLVVGSPTQRLTALPSIIGFLNGIPAKSLQGVRVAGFDTRLTQAEIESIRVLYFFVKIFGYAAEPIAKRLVKKGGTQAVPPEGFYVAGMEGPLLDGELERAVEWGRRIATG
jgi:flavodoxin